MAPILNVRCPLGAPFFTFPRRKMAQKISEYEEQLEALLTRCSNLEKQKSRLQSEVEVLIMDLEKATAHAQNLEKRVAQLEKLNIDLKSKVEELTILLEQSQRELRQKVAEIQKLQHEYEKMREQRDALQRENKKLVGVWSMQACYCLALLLYVPPRHCPRARVTCDSFQLELG